MSKLREYVIHSIGGGWGKETFEDGLEKVSIIRGTDFPKLEIGDYSTVPVRYETEKKVKSRKIEVGDLIIEVSGGSASSGQRTGRVLYITSEILNKLGNNVIPASFCRLLRLNKDLVNPKFIAFQIKEMHLSDEIAFFENQSTGISNFQFNLFLDEFEPKIESIKQQEQVVDILESVNKKIFLNYQMNDSLEQIAQAIFKSWFIDFDPVKAKIEGGIEQAMAVISGKNATELHRLQTENPTAYRELHQLANAFPDEMVEVEGFGQVPRGWEVKSIADKQILEIIKPKIYPFDGEKEYIATANVSKNSIVGELEIITYDERPTRANMQPIVDSIWFAKMVGEHKAILIDKDDKQLLDNTILSTGFLGLKPNKNKKCFVYCYINSPYFEQAKNQLATGAVQIALNNTSFGKIEIVLPNEDVLSYFEEKISFIFSMISQNQRENQNLAKIRDLLLPKLLSGEV